MKKHPAEEVNDKMIDLQKDLDRWRKRKSSALRLLDSVISNYGWYKARNKFPPTTQYTGNDGYTIIREPDDILMQVRVFEHDIMLACSELRNSQSYLELAGDPDPVPKSWVEVEQMKQNIEEYFEILAANTADLRKKYVIQIIQLYAKLLFIKVNKNGEISPKYLKVKKMNGLIYIVKFEYDYKKKMLVGVSEDGKKVPAINLTRK